MPLDFIYDSSWLGISAKVSLAYQRKNSTWPVDNTHTHARTHTHMHAHTHTSSLVLVTCKLHVYTISHS